MWLRCHSEIIEGNVGRPSCRRAPETPAVESQRLRTFLRFPASPSSPSTGFLFCFSLLFIFHLLSPHLEHLGVETRLIIWHLQGRSGVRTFCPGRRVRFLLLGFPARSAARSVHTSQSSAVRCLSPFGAGLGPLLEDARCKVSVYVSLGWAQGVVRRFLIASQNMVSCHKIQTLAGTYPSGFLFIFCLLF